MRAARSLLIVTVLAALTSGCTGEDSPTPEPSAAPGGDGIRDGLAALYAGDHATATDEDTADCFADALLERASVEELRAGGLVTTDDSVVTDAPPLPRELAETWVDAQLACVDFYEEFARAHVDVMKGKADEAAYAACLREKLDQTALRAGLVAALTGSLDASAMAPLASAQSACD